MKNKKKQEKDRKTALMWKECSEIPEVASICQTLLQGCELSVDLQEFANRNPRRVRRGMAFLGLYFAAEDRDGILKFRRSRAVAGGVPNVIVSICKAMRATPSLDVRPEQEPAWNRPGSFYATETWKRLRYAALVASSGRCSCCGRSAKEGAILRVDHIKPIRTHPELKADATNLQVLCNDCNWGKGSWDETDWRSIGVQTSEGDGQSLEETHQEVPVLG